MAFPTNPSNGDTYTNANNTTYEYDATDNKWIIVGNQSASFVLANDQSPQLGADLDLNSYNIDFPTTANISDCIDDDDFSSASATTLATSESIDEYAQNHPKNAWESRCTITGDAAGYTSIFTSGGQILFDLDEYAQVEFNRPIWINDVRIDEDYQSGDPYYQNGDGVLTFRIELGDGTWEDIFTETIDSNGWSSWHDVERYVKKIRVVCTTEDTGTYTSVIIDEIQFR